MADKHPPQTPRLGGLSKSGAVEHQETAATVGKLVELQAEPRIEIMVYPTFFKYAPEDVKRPIYFAAVRGDRTAESDAPAVFLENRVAAYDGRAKQH